MQKGNNLQGVGREKKHKSIPPASGELEGMLSHNFAYDLEARIAESRYIFVQNALEHETVSERAAIAAILAFIAIQIDRLLVAC